MRDAQAPHSTLEKSLEILVSVVGHDQESPDISGGSNKSGIFEFLKIVKILECIQPKHFILGE